MKLSEKFINECYNDAIELKKEFKATEKKNGT